MDQLKKWQCSRRGHRSHLTKLLSNIDKILNKLPAEPLTNFDVASLEDYLKLLKQKATVFADIDQNILDNLDSETDYEALVLDSEELQMTLSQKISLLTHQLTASRSEVSSTAAATTRDVSPQSNMEGPISTTQNTTVNASLQSASMNTLQTQPPSNLPPTVPNADQPQHDTTDPLSLETNSGRSANHLNSQFVTRLPKLDVPHFAGETLKWQSFWDCFEAAIHFNPCLTGVQKLSYLRAQLSDDAARVIAGLPLTNSNYEHSISLLRDRYGQPHKLINAHVQALIDIPRPVNKLTSLQLFHDTVEGHIRCLQSLGKSPDTLETLLAPIMLGKLPEETKKNIARTHESNQWTVQQLQTALLREIRIFETGQQTTSMGSQEQILPTASFYTAADRRSGNKRKELISKQPTCVYCKGNHFSTNCEVHKDTESRLAIIKREKLCYNCLAHHRVSQCGSKNRCRKCKSKHHTSICNNAAPASVNTSENHEQPTPITTTTTTLTTLTPPQLTRNAACLLKTAIATVVGSDSQAEARILFDEGSQRSFLTEKLANELTVEPYKFEHISLSSFGADKPLYKRMDSVMIHVKSLSGELIPLSALVVPTIATPITNTLEMDISQLPHLKGLPLAHPITAAENFEISLLVGADFYWDLVGDHIIRGKGPTAMSSKLGYLLSGPVLPPQKSGTVVKFLHVTTNHEDEECNLQRFWQVEDTAITRRENSSQQFLESYCASHISRQDNGTYSAGFPWKDSHPPLPDNFTTCQKRTRSLVHRLTQSPGLLQVYDNILKEQLNRGFIELVTEPYSDRPTHYIPHHPVKKDSTTTPVRIVYDCSCRQSNDHPSLNDCLIAGPHFLVDLCAILLRFRTHQYGLSTDIEKAFLQVTLKESDRDFTRFLWLSNPLDPTSEFVIYRFRRVLFGAVSSPFMLFATLYYHLKLYGTPLSNTIQSNLYVDNVVTGCETEPQAIQYFQEARSMMHSAGFNLRAWASNCESLNTKAREHGIASDTQFTNILGLQWNTLTDCLSLATKMTNAVIHKSFTTKREVLKEASKLFDPLGITSPVSVRAKLFMQKLWQIHVEWDEPLETDTNEEWTTILRDIQQLSKLILDRRFLKTKFSPGNITLHVFADASSRAYGAVAFFTSDSEVALVMAKNRVAPLKRLTLPKLELMAAVVACRIAKFIVDSLQLQDCPIHFWGDSQIALHWLESTKTLPQFVSNRVREIKETFPTATWAYCPTNDNPADLLTRGITFQSLSSSENLWWKGPPWLTTPNCWPKWQPRPDLHLHATAAIAVEFVPQPKSSQDTTGLHQVITLTNYSSLNKLLAVTAYVYRYINNLRRSKPRLIGPLTAEELNSAQTRWIRNCQERVYQKEMLSAKPKPGCYKASMPPLVRQLRLFIDEAGLLRCGGRIHNAPLSELAKFPYLLPQNNHLTELFVNHVHARSSHAGVGSTLTALRQSFWIPTGRQYVKKLLRRCTVCKQFGGRPYAEPEAAPLPKIRVQEVPPFSITGVDFTGALYVKKTDGEESKAYICLFTCATSRAVHLEVVTELSTTSFLLAFRRFAARRSLPQMMMSDNATTFTSAAGELTNLLDSEEIRTLLGREGIIWKFIPKKAPWFGGYWERLIGLTKASIKKTLGRAHITLMTLQTIIVEVEALQATYIHIR